jgi:5-methylcytosine-specific restriction endonuclease McrA
MKSIPKSWTIYTLCQRENKINPTPQYQRGPVWNLAKKQKLIDSILRGYDVPKLYLRPSSDPAFEHEVVDGQQRLRAVWEFSRDEYALGDDSEDLPKFGDLSEKKHSDLSSDAQELFGLFDFSIVVIDEADELETRDLFLRLQEGVVLNAAEKRNAMVGDMRDFVATTSMHKVFQGVRMAPNIEQRFGKDDWIAHVSCLEMNGGPVDVKAPDLKKMYETYKSLGDYKSKTNKISRTLDYMAKVFEIETPEMDIKWGFVDLYWLLSVLLDEYDLKGREKDFNVFYITFERRRRDVDDIEELITSQDHLDRLLFNYVDAFQRSGATRKNIEIRHDVYREWLHNIVQDLVPKDPKRLYTYQERMVIWRRARERCENCSQEIPFSSMHADHLVPHSRGGKTTIANSKCLCTSCNLKKGAKEQSLDG